MENISRAQIECLKSLSRDESVVITRLDKGHGVAILDKDDYRAKIHNILDDESKFQIAEEPTDSHPLKLIFRLEDKTKRLLKQLNKDGAISDDDTSFATPVGSKLGHIYGLPKIHKPGTPLRPVVSAVGTHNLKLAKVMAPLFSQWAFNWYD